MLKNLIKIIIENFNNLINKIKIEYKKINFKENKLLFEEEEEKFAKIRQRLKLLRKLKRKFQKTKDLRNVKTYHEFHMVDPSPWPFICAWGAFFCAIGFVQFMHNYVGGKITLMFGLFTVLYGTFFWFRDIIREATYENKHTPIVKRGLAKAMLLFILSESMFFFAIFWAFLYTAAAPAIHVGSLWPPKATPIMDPSGVAIANSAVLIASGIGASWAHYTVGQEKNTAGALSLLATTILSIIFLALQYDEYLSSPFTVSDSAYGSCFFLVTGCHGFHVFVGTIAIIVAGFRTYAGHFKPNDMMGLDFTVWYWHFVDVVWLAVFLLIYEWGNLIARDLAAKGIGY